MKTTVTHLLCAVIIGCLYAEHAEITPKDLFTAEKRFNNLTYQSEKLLAGFIRLGFHDCVGECDGCVDLAAPDNFGLEHTVAVAKQFQSDYLPQLSVADVYAYLAIKSLEETVRRAGGSVKIGLKRGRVDCPPDDFPTRIFPLGNDPTGVKFLENEFGLTTRQAVALLGCHSVGRTRPESSGYHGKWDFTEFVMDNGYFRNVIASGWVLEQVSNDVLNATQFSKGDDMMMLLADMALFRSLTNLGDFFHMPSCNFYTCRLAHTYRIHSARADAFASAWNSPQVREFANDMAAFHQELAVAFTRMLENTPHELTLYGDQL